LTYVNNIFEYKIKYVKSEMFILMVPTIVKINDIYFSFLKLQKQTVNKIKICIKTYFKYFSS